jgi:DNA sulfur modification protein DndB
MIKNLLPRAELIGFARKQSTGFDTKSVTPPQVEEVISDGWHVARKGRTSVRVTKPKKKSDFLESRVWTLFYRMGFQHLSGRNGCGLTLSADVKDGPEDQIDVVAVDSEVGLAVECKSVENPKKDQSLPDWISRFAGMRKRFSDSIRRAVPTDAKRHTAMIVFTWDIILTENDRTRAEEQAVTIFDHADLEYFEALVKHLGTAARYQFLCEVFRGKPIHGLAVRVPALRTRMGRNTCYTFSIRPEYLLKIGYVAHRAKGKAIDVDMYQRMISKGRLNKIAEYVSEGGTFPTNIVINIREKRYAEFQRGEQKGDAEGALFGWLTLRPAYGCAWIIDGQHRLFAYSGHDRAGKDFLNVLAYEALSSGDQAQMFVDINSEQRKVKRALLVELDAALKWNAQEEDDRIQAIISKAGLALDADLDSPLCNRILLSDVPRTDERCVSLTSISAALRRQGFFIVARKKDITEYGPLWRPDPSASLKRTIHTVKAWLSVIADSATDWWALGAGDGGGLAMNNGVTICLNVLRSVMEHIGYGSLRTLDNNDLTVRLSPFANSLGGYLGRMSQDERRRFRQLQGSDGQITGTRQCQVAIKNEHPQFSPPQLQEWIDDRKKNHNEQGRGLIEWIETSLQKHVLQILKSEHDSEPESWWWDGVPKAVRKKVDDRMNESNGKTGGREQNFDLIHYREIVTANWDLFKDIFGFAAAGGGKDKQTNWIVEVGEMRNIVMHPSRQQFLSAEDVDTLQKYVEWLKGRITYIQTGVESPLTDAKASLKDGGT